MTPEHELSRGRDAQQLLSHPLLAEAFQTIEDEVKHAWEGSPANDLQGRERLWMMLKLLSRVRQHLDSVVNSGKMAERTIADRAKSAIGRSPWPL